MEQDVKNIYIEVPQDVDGYLPMDYRPVWQGDVLMGVEVFYYYDSESFSRAMDDDIVCVTEPAAEVKNS